MPRSARFPTLRAGIVAVVVLLTATACSSGTQGARSGAGTPSGTPSVQRVPAPAPVSDPASPAVRSSAAATPAGGAPAGSSSPLPSAARPPSSGASGPPRTSATPSSSSSSPTAPSSSASFDPRRHSVDDPRSIWVVVDKRRPLQPRSWVPEDLVQPAVPHTNRPLLREPAARALERLVAAAAADGVRVVSLSAYRAFTTQRSIYDRNVRAMGRAATDLLTARPGYSEHQTGLADDLGDGSGRCPIRACFATTPAGRWLAADAWRYGFIQRYPKGQQAQTGIQWEPWHYRYVGAGLARRMHRTGERVLERVLDLPASPDYR